MALEKLLSDRRRLLFIMSLCLTIGTWAMALGDWSRALTTGGIGALFIGLANNVFANMIKNVGLMGRGVTNESDPATQNPPNPPDKDD